MKALRQFKVYKISIHLYCGSHVGRQENAVFPYNIIENSQTSLSHNSVLKDVLSGRNDFKFDTQTDIVGHIKIWGKLIVIFISMFLMTSFANHRCGENSHLIFIVWV